VCGGRGLQSSLTKQQRDKVQSFINFVGCSCVAASGAVVCGRSPATHNRAARSVERRPSL